MKNFRKKWVYSMLTATLVFAMIVGGIPGLAFAQQGIEPEQMTDKTDTGIEQSEQKTGESVNGTEDELTDKIDLTSASAANAAETAVITAPNRLLLDGSKNYAILAKCTGGNHTYGIGSDASVTAELGIPGKDLVPGNAVSLSQEGLGWSIKKTGDDLIISSIFARGGTLSDRLR